MWSTLSMLYFHHFVCVYVCMCGCCLNLLVTFSLWIRIKLAQNDAYFFITACDKCHYLHETLCLAHRWLLYNSMYSLLNPALCRCCTDEPFVLWSGFVLLSLTSYAFVFVLCNAYTGYLQLVVFRGVAWSETCCSWWSRDRKPFRTISLPLKSCRLLLLRYVESRQMPA